MKKRIFKSVLSLLLVLAMVMGNVPVYVAAQDTANEALYPTGEKEPQGFEIEDTTGYAKASSFPEDNASPYWSQFSTRYYYNQLPAEWKTIWDAWDNACSAFLEGNANAEYIDYLDDYITAFAPMPSSMTTNDKVTLLKLFRYSNPQYYFLDLNYVYSSTEIALVIYPAFANGNTRAAYTQQFKAVLDSWIAAIPMSARPEEKEKVIHDIITSNITYVANDYDQSAFSAVCMGQTVCAGYTMSVQLLGKAAGLEVIPVFGTSSGEGHAWNKINLHGIWYLLDTTWDDSGSYFKYYNKSDANGGSRTNNAYIKSWVPASAYSSVSTNTYTPGYFIFDDIVYFSIDGTSSYFAWAVDAGVSAPTAIPTGTNRDGKIYAVAGADSYAKIKTFVIRLYDIHLNRDPDAAGLNNWAFSLATGSATSASAIHGIVTSQEYVLKGLSFDTMVEQMYLSMLGRASDASGKATWVSCLSSGMTLTSIVNGFSGSQEFANVCASYGMLPGSVAITEARDLNPGVTKFVFRCYSEALGRLADVDGLNSWCGALIGKAVTPKQVAEQFVLSDEVKMRNLDNAQFVEMLYRFCMGRSADASGGSYWVSVLNQGFPREYVLNEFVNSAEFAAIVASFGL